MSWQVLLTLPAQCKEPPIKAFLDQIYRHYVGSSVGEGKGVALTNPKIVRAYFTMGLASLIIEDRAVETRHGEQPVPEGDPFVGHPEWDISNLVIEVKEIGPFKATGIVTFTNGGKPEKIVLELQRFGPDWRIADIGWESGSLRSTFRRKAPYRNISAPR